MSNELDQVKEAIGDRLKDRFWGAFLISFVIINWRGGYILLFPSSEVGFEDRLERIEELYPCFLLTFGKTVVLPLLLSSVSVAFVPRLATVLERWRLKAFVKRHNELAEIEKERKDYQYELTEARKQNEDLNKWLLKEQDKVRDITSKLQQGVSAHETERKAFTAIEQRYVKNLILLMEKLKINRVYLAYGSRPNRDPNDQTIKLLDAMGLIEQDGHSWYKRTQMGDVVLELWVP